MKFLQNKEKLKFFSALLILFVVGGYIFALKGYTYWQRLQPTPTPPPPKTLGIQVNPTPQESEYMIFLVGDSMTHALGPHGGEFNKYINELYKDTGKGILIDNYAVGGSNILNLKKMISTHATYWDSSFSPLMARKFDIIIIESFGYNPLSQYPIKEGLKKHNEVLDEVLRDLRTSHPDAKIVFLATIAPNKEKYSSGVSPDTTPEQRRLQAEERIAYIKNHIEYAKKNDIPLINVFELSLDDKGDGDLRYINPDDYIHPSFEGVRFIGKEIADYIWENRLLPH